MHKRKIAIWSGIIFVVALFLFYNKIESYIHAKHFETMVWKSHDNYNYRCPGIVITKKGTLIAYCEKRVGTSDRTVMDIVYKRSTDNGKTWSNNFVLASGIAMNYTMDNPVMVVGDSGRIHCIYTKNVGKRLRNGYVAYTYSDDDGVSWSLPRDISAVTRPEERGLFAPGPGHGIKLHNGTLLFPVWYSLKLDPDNQNDAYPSVVSTLYSLDDGQNWHMGESIHGNDELVNPNESTLVELSNCSVMINMRSTTKNYLRSVSISQNGFSDWKKPIFDENLASPICFGSLCKYDNLILFASPIFNSKQPRSRQKASIKISKDDGVTWFKEKQLVKSKGGYMDINSSVESKPYIYGLTEVKDKGKYSIKIIVFNKKWLEQ